MWSCDKHTCVNTVLCMWSCDKHAYVNTVLCMWSCDKHAYVNTVLCMWSCDKHACVNTIRPWWCDRWSNTLRNMESYALVVTVAVYKVLAYWFIDFKMVHFVVCLSFSLSPSLLYKIRTKCCLVIGRPVSDERLPVPCSITNLFLFLSTVLFPFPWKSTSSLRPPWWEATENRIFNSSAKIHYQWLM